MSEKQNKSEQAINRKHLGLALLLATSMLLAACSGSLPASATALPTEILSTATRQVSTPTPMIEVTPEVATQISALNAFIFEGVVSDGIDYRADPFGQIHFIENGVDSFSSSTRRLIYDTENPELSEIVNPETEVIVSELDDSLPFTGYEVVVGPVDADVHSIIPKAWEYAVERMASLLSRTMASNNLSLPPEYVGMTEVEFIESLASKFNNNNIVTVGTSAASFGDYGYYFVAVPPLKPETTPEEAEQLLDPDKLLSVLLTPTKFDGSDNPAVAMLNYIDPFQPGNDTDLLPEHLKQSLSGAGRFIFSPETNQFALNVFNPAAAKLLPNTDPKYQTDEFTTSAVLVHEFTHLVSSLLGEYPYLMDAMERQQIVDLGYDPEVIMALALSQVEQVGQNLTVSSETDRQGWIDTRQEVVRRNLFNEILSGMSIIDFVRAGGLSP